MKKLLGLLVMSGAVLAALFFLTSLARIGGGPMPHAITLKSASAIHEGAVVSIEYTLTDDAGKMIDSNVGKDPLSYIHGAGQIVRGLERELNGLKVGDRKKVQVTPQDGYGPINEKAFQEIPREGIPPEAQKPGAMLMTKAPDGRAIPVRVHEVKEKTVVVDLNHPLAGKTLNFEVKVIDVQTSSVPAR
jgi:FKBP-type peptidyl-prolyl cis-trans isomerase SlyD